MTRMDSPGDGDYRLDAPDEAGSSGGDGPAGYDLQGIGGQPIHDTQPTAPQPQGRMTRESVPLNTYEGEEEKGSDYLNRDRGFRFRNRQDGI